MSGAALARFGAAYAGHRAEEGRGYADDDLFSLPYLRRGPFAKQWTVRARTFEAFAARVVRPEARRLGRPLSVLDLGAGNGWLSYRIARAGHFATALDIRDDRVDGLGAATPFLDRASGRMQRLAASFEAIPLAAASMDIAVFNASLHYAIDLETALREAARVVRPGGTLAILDSPFYRRESHGLAMVAEKRAQAGARFGARAEALLALPFIEFLTRERLADASGALGRNWRRRPVRYPLWYDLRPVQAALGRERPPSRFDLWTSVRP
jgi:SAM-dependent methyltransferase